METIERVVKKLQAVQSSTRSAANKQLLSECIEDLMSLWRVAIEEKKATEHYSFAVRQRVKLKDGSPYPLTPEGKQKRFLINTVDEEKGRAWVVDAFGIDRPCFLALSILEPAND